MAEVQHVTDQNFESEVLNSDKPVVIDFWAEWCAPCRMMLEAITRLASDFEGRARIGKLNVDENKRTSERYNIRGIPAVFVFKDGELKEEVVGVTSREYLSGLIENHLETL
jgi:thioredoxin 1